ncbi:MAG: orotate phosphoribosyltransferase [Methylococcaceae bacterium]|nr:orotate phosphoribosyltransferase [Methylococcaceae bacterium]
MFDYQREFIEFSMSCQVLRFGRFTLKSGRTSPYFFNAGLFNTGGHLARLGNYYASTYLEMGVRADVLYGPAYKGIPLACSAAMVLSERTGSPAPFAFNRKEAKTHGETGSIVGSPLKGKVLIVDDVITAGTSVRESVEIIREAGAEPCGVLILLDRRERGNGERSAVEEVTAQFGVPVYSVVTLDHIIEFLGATGATAELDAITEYQSRYGVN